MILTTFDIFDLLLIVELGFMILFPAIFMPIKIGIIMLLEFLIILDYIKGDRKVCVNKGVLSWCFIYVGVNLVYVILNFFTSNKDQFSRINLEIIEPILFTVLVTAIGERTLIRLIRSIKWITIFAIIYNIIFTLSINSFIPTSIADYMPGMTVNYGGLGIGLVKFGSQSLSWLIFLWPIFFCAYMYDYDSSISNALLILGGIVNAILSMRTAFLIIIILSPIFCLFFVGTTKSKSAKKKLYISLLILTLLFAFLMFVNSSIFVAVLSKIKDSFSIQSTVNSYGIVDPGGKIRNEQLQDLIETWKIKPILGWGDTANSLHVIRSDVSGIYELTYLAMLMQRGLIGFLIYCFQMFWIFIEGIKIQKERDEMSQLIIPVLIGFLSILIANATNPYLQSFDRLIILFIPLAFINVCSLKQNQESNVY